MTKHKAMPAISIILSVDAHDKSLPEKLAALRNIDYPQDKLDFVFIADDAARLRSLERTNMQITILRSASNRDAELKQAVSWAQSNILVFGEPDENLHDIASRFNNPRLRETRFSNGVCAMRREQFEKPAVSISAQSIWAQTMAFMSTIFAVRGVNLQRAH